jgi:uncharacterized protein YgiM (DUF1202 family)
MPRFGTVRWNTVPAMLFVVCAFLATHGALAATKEPPYEAIVESDEAFFRCGPGKNFYPTGSLVRGDRVTVRRHDPGGWFMIDPPAGSYSLIPADAVQREGNVGTVKPLAEGQTPIRIGSAIDPTIDSVYQRQLSTGERVEILGETTRTHRGTPVLMFKIRSPKGEYRWIEGMNLIPVDQHIAQQQIRDQQTKNSHVRQPTDSDPFAAGSPTQNPPQAAAPSPVAKKPVAKLISLSPTTNVVRKPVTQQALPATNAPAAVATIPAVEPHTRLEQIDLQFREMTQRHPTTWNLGQLEQAYRELSQQTRSVAMRGQIDLRFSAIAHYKQVKSEYDDYFRLVSATARKDAELAAVQNSLDPRDARPAIMPPEQAGPSLQSPTMVAPNSAGPAIPVPATGTPSAPAPAETQVTPTVPEFNPGPQKQATPQVETHASGAVLENPVPLPTDPQPGPSSQPLIQSQPPIQSQPLIQPQPTVVSRPGVVAAPETYPSHELPTQQSMGSPAAPIEQPSRHLMESQVQPPQANIVQPAPQMMPAPQFAPAPQSAPGLQSAPAPLPNSAIASASPQPSVASLMPATAPLSQMPSAPVTQMPNAPIPPQLAPPQQLRPQAPGGLDGAGIVQQAATPIPGGPRHVLLAPNGRILAYLYPDRGVNLDAYVGRAMGIFGPRGYRPELRNDLIVVRGLVPVRLTP